MKHSVILYLENGRATYVAGIVKGKLFLTDLVGQAFKFASQLDAHKQLATISEHNFANVVRTEVFRR